MKNCRYTGVVTRGNQKGRTWGFPTVNVMDILPNFLLDKGVYAAQVLIGERWLNAMLYAGTRPTLHLTAPTIEIHIFDFAADLYDQQLTFQVLQKVRDEQQFDSVQQLIEQLKRDEQTIRHYFLTCTQTNLGRL